MNRTFGFICVVACATGASQAGFLADSMEHRSTENTGSSFEVLFEYMNTGVGTGELTITIDNTTPMAVGGFLTGIIFNIQSMDPGAAGTLASSSNPNFLNTPNANGQPFGTNFDAGAALGANWEGGGTPSFGVAIGDSATFVFSIFASDADLLTDTSFSTPGIEDPSFIVRFRGGIDSDKVPANPAPGAVALLGLGGLAASRRRR
ncbi:MAG: hypothetical protein RLN60_01130 [Phycisphaerales bacterium]